MAAGAATPKATGPTLLGRAQKTSAIKTIVISCQENHSYDHYFGSYSKNPAGYGIPDPCKCGSVQPFHFTEDTDDGYDPNHDWTSTHEAYAGGKMTGFMSNGNSKDVMGYYEAADLPFYYSLLPDSVLKAEHHCGMLSETLPNRMILYAGTSGGITDDSAPSNGSLSWPCIIHLLIDAKLTYKNYNFHAPTGYSYLNLWSGGSSSLLNQSSSQLAVDAKAGTLPNVVYIEKQTPWDEHPPANIHQGETMMQGIYKTIMDGPQYKAGEVVLIHTYDEGGGFFDHRKPKEIDAFGSGIRVPMIVTSPLAKVGTVDTTYSDHASVLKFIEAVYGLPTLASLNSTFNKSTPSSAGQGGGKPFPPRDGSSEISDLSECFTDAI
jgi:phospholipase C